MTAAVTILSPLAQDCRRNALQYSYRELLHLLQQAKNDYAPIPADHPDRARADEIIAGYTTAAGEVHALIT